MKKILHIIDQRRIGGPGKTILNSAKFIQNDKYEIHIAGFREIKSGLNEILDSAKEQKIPCLELADFKGINPLQIIEIGKYIKKNKINIFHTHGYKTNLIGLLVKIIVPEVNLVATYHGWIGNNTKQKIYKYMDTFVSYFYDGVISVSKRIHKTLPKARQSEQNRIIVHNAIVIDDYKPKGIRESVRASIGVKSKDFVIGVFGRLSIEKGCFQIIEAIKRIRSKNHDVILLMIGEGPLSDEIHNVIERLGLSDAVIRFGYQKQIQKYYEAIDLYVSPSLTEGISNVILEAKAYKVPIVATNVGGTPEIITHKKDGLLVPAGSPEAIADAIEMIFKHPDIGRKYSANGFCTLEERFSFVKRMEKMGSLYDRL